MMKQQNAAKKLLSKRQMETQSTFVRGLCCFVLFLASYSLEANAYQTNDKVILRYEGLELTADKDNDSACPKKIGNITSNIEGVLEVNGNGVATIDEDRGAFKNGWFVFGKFIESHDKPSMVFTVTDEILTSTDEILNWHFDIKEFFIDSLMNPDYKSEVLINIYARFSNTSSVYKPGDHVEFTLFSYYRNTNCRYESKEIGTWNIEKVSRNPTHTASKNLGEQLCTCPKAEAGNPINTGTGNKFQRELDYLGGVGTGLSLQRFYNSQQSIATDFGSNWHSNWHRSIALPEASTAVLTRADGKVITFRQSNLGSWVTDADTPLSLSEVYDNGTQLGWKLVSENNSSEYYAMTGTLHSIVDRAGTTTSLSYDANQHLSKVTGPFGHILAFNYDSNNRIASVTQPDGGVIAYNYDTNNDLVSVSYPDQSVRRYIYNEPSYTSSTDLPHALTGIIDENDIRFASFTYDAKGRAISSEHAGGAQKVSISYNADGSSSITDALANTYSYQFETQFDTVKPTEVTGAAVQNMGAKTYTYHANGFIASQTDWNDNLTTYTRDARGLELSRTEASGTPQARTVSTSWHATYRLPTKIIEPSGIAGINRITEFTYDDVKGRLLQKTVTAGDESRTWKYSYNTTGQLLGIIDPNGHNSLLEYDAQGGLAKITNALNQSTTITNDANGRPITVTDPNGMVISIVYTPRGQIASHTVDSESTVYDYDKAGNLTQVTSPNGAFLAYSYNAAHQLIRITDAFSDYIEFELDKKGNRLSSTVYNANNQVVRESGNNYDVMGRPTEFIGSENQKSNLEYDKNGNLIGIIDPLSHEQRKTYDALNRLTQEIDANGGKVLYNYDNSDNLILVTDPLGHTTKYSRNGFDEVTQLSSPDTGITTYRYDTNGNVLNSTDARGKQTRYEYDALDRVVVIHRHDGGKVTFQYDNEPNAVGRLVAMNDDTGTTHWSYDNQGRVIKKTQSFAGEELSKITYSYDEIGNLSKMIYPSGYVVSYQYDKGRLNQVNVNGVPLVSEIKYTPFGGIASMQYLNGTTYSRSFDHNGRISQYTALGPRNFSLDYDAAGRISNYTDSESVINQNMNYDPLGRIIEASGFFGNESYSYDANGNRTGHKINGESAEYTYAPESNRLLSTTIKNANTINRVYDNAGNTVSIGDQQFNYNDLGRMISGGGAAYYYNGLGQRIYKSTTNSFVSYDETGHIIGEYTYHGPVVNETIYIGDIPVAVGTADGAFFINPDHLNAPRVMTDMKGEFTSFWPFVPFGERGLINAGKQINYNARFPGQFYDSETGLHYNGFRDYDPSSGRYIESDPIGLKGGLNSYGYAGGQPITRVDYMGMKYEDPMLTIADRIAGIGQSSENNQVSISSEVMSIGSSGVSSLGSLVSEHPLTKKWFDFRTKKYYSSNYYGNQYRSSGSISIAKGISRIFGRASKILNAYSLCQSVKNYNNNSSNENTVDLALATAGMVPNIIGYGSGMIQIGIGTGKLTGWDQALGASMVYIYSGFDRDVAVQAIGDTLLNK